MIIAPDILERFVNQLPLTFPVLAASYNGVQTTFTLETILHLRAGLNVQIVGGPSVGVVGVNHDLNTFQVVGDFRSAQAITLPTPFFFHGTPYAVNSHISRLSDASKVPMIYLLEIIRQQVGDPINDRARYTQVRLFFLDVANYADWDTDQHYSNVIAPQMTLVEYFIEQMRQTRNLILDDRGGYIIAHAKFGEFVNDKGHLQSIFNDRLSGVELNIELLLKVKPCN